jgi:hypothetical protein
MASPEPKNITVTNNDQGPRYVFTSRGMEVVPAGGVLETVASDAQIEGITSQTIQNTDKAPMFTVEGGDDATKAPEPLEGMGVAKLRSIAEAEDVQLTGRKDGETDLPDLKTAKEIAEAITAKRNATANA